MKVAYLVNQYPKVSHSFIRREILGVEAGGISVSRFSIRSCRSELVDRADLEELAKTTVILDQGIPGLLKGLTYTALTKPIQFAKAVFLAFRMGWRSERGLLLHFAYLAEACVLAKRLSALKITHIHAHFGTNSTTVALLCKAIANVSYSFTVHGPEEFDKAGAIALQKKIEQAAFVVAVSSFGKSQLYRWCSYDQWSKIHEVHCGVDEDFLAPTQLLISESSHFVCVARLSEQKGHFLLLEAVRTLAAEGLQFKLLLVGDGELRGAIETFIQKFQLQNYVQLVGWATTIEVQHYLSSSRVMVMPSFAEGLPVVLMEAMALGRPVISTYVAGIPELVRSDCGWLIPPGSVEALVEAMRSALQQPVEVLNQMGAIGAKRVAQRHDIRIEANKLAALLVAQERQISEPVPTLARPALPHSSL